MKKLAVLFVCVAMLASCDSFKGGSKDLKAENDSLLMELNQRNAELDDMMGTFNEVVLMVNHDTWQLKTAKSTLHFGAERLHVLILAL